MRKHFIRKRHDYFGGHHDYNQPMHNDAWPTYRREIVAAIKNHMADTRPVSASADFDRDCI